ncbi:exported hypothetical protein [Vibrio chagasii]|nr:exported hypothetical protein [Vibrio chagasii]CAH7062995.1 exported hypothetical protein [Vibrio chagasii]CAH7079202.1 exported hypothetical protein [Vibrio chagasii]CAH7196544.1 exported hypothetical protein [Vibrio chagasii]CAH7220817.1 exported hypothetical protein [Vibrio chagasii]
MKVISLILTAMMGLLTFSSLASDSSADAKFSGIVGGDIRSVYNALQLESGEMGSTFVWVNDESISVNTYQKNNVSIQEIEL